MPRFPELSRKAPQPAWHRSAYHMPCCRDSTQSRRCLRDAVSLVLLLRRGFSGAVSLALHAGASYPAPSAQMRTETKAPSQSEELEKTESMGLFPGRRGVA
ncbi:hypothetical protein AA21291_0764 [Swaminathania salitolerans LMG 21291]|uniref:Uncharacterized protein n=1 Tax=Swaminathania salitolerans TaxID=182838 RepID=A0A511BS38_9PROT|nr:hypothetical protein AA21291_0764 [Swaminathania salitolerans LMG 21291]GEL02424.1 hypothetical protein SSA02_15870 [Swaminathania salitolerans]